MKNTGFGPNKPFALKNTINNWIRLPVGQIRRRVDVTRSTVQQWESGQIKGRKPENLYAVAKALEVSLEWLITGREPDAIHVPLATKHRVTCGSAATHALIDAILESDRQGKLLPATANALRELILSLK